MCGIVGLAGQVHKKETDVFTDLLIFSQVRGPHSTGVAAVDRQRERVEVAKTIGRPDNLIDWDKRYDKVVSYGKKFILGHNRWATTGKIIKKNAHPFAFDHIVGCHNGTIPEYRLNRLRIPFDTFDTDSECVLANINKFPLNDVMSELIGAWAFVWYDTRDNSVNMLRNKERTLFYTYSEDREQLYWASEAGMLKAALDRNNVRRDKIVYDVTVDKHVKWIIPSAGKKFDKPTQEDVKTGELETWRGHSASENTGGLFQQQRDHNTQAGKVVQFPGKPGTLSLPNLKNTSVLTKDNDDTLIEERWDKESQSWIKVATHQLISSSNDAAKGQNSGTPCPVTCSEFRDPLDLKNFDGQGYLNRKVSGKKSNVYRGFRGEILSQVDFENATKEGCVWCDATAVWGQPVRFIEPKRHICLQCNADPMLKEMFPSQKAG